MQGEHFRQMPERIDYGPRHLTEPAGIVAGVHGTEIPHGVFVERAEKDELDNDPRSLAAVTKSSTAENTGVVPTAEVKLHAAIGIAGRHAAGPRSDQPSAGWSKRVVLDLK